MRTDEVLRQAREDAGLTQGQLARRAGTSQAAISAYESGARSPAVSTLERLLAACGMRARLELERRPGTQAGGPVSAALREHRGELRRALAALGVRQPRVFGSVARGEDGPNSDLDLLVDLPRRSYIVLEQVRDAAEGVLQLRVDVSTPELLKDEIRDKILDEAVPL